MSRSGSNSRFSMSWPLTNNLRDVFRVPAPIETSRRFQKKNPYFPDIALNGCSSIGVRRRPGPMGKHQLWDLHQFVGQKLGSSQAFIWIHHLRKTRRFGSHEFNPPISSTKNWIAPWWNTNWWKKLSENAVSSIFSLVQEKAKKKTIFHRPIWYRRVEKNIETLWTISKWYEDIPKKHPVS